MNLEREYAEKVKAKLQEICNDKKLVIWGASPFGYGVFRSFKKHGFEEYIVAFCDNCKTKWNTYIDNLKVLSYEQIKENYRNSIIFMICSDRWKKDIEKQLIDLKEQYIFVDVENNSDIYVMFKLMELLEKSSKTSSTGINKKEFNKLIDETSLILDDEESKNTLYARINFLKTANWKSFYNININKPQYFLDDFYKLTDKEIYVDLGAYNGDTILKFINTVGGGGKYKKIIAFEADKENYKLLKTNIKKNNLNNIDIYNLASWNKKTNISFDNDSSASSHIAENLDNKVQAEALDNLFLDIPITFIKMDIEGAEKESLFGTKKIIQKYKPKLAICVYHKWEDIYKIPRIIKSFVPEYKIYLRHHSYSLNETVCYACL